MRINKLMVLVPALMFTAACGQQDDSSKIDDALSNDLALASSAQPYMPQQFVSPQEMGYGYQPGYAQPQYYPAAQQGYPQQVVYRAPAPAPAPTVRRASTAGRVATRSEPVRNTKRDAIIGAAAGAVLGQAIGKDTKSTVIGAVAGGVLGGVIGHTIDVKR